MSEPNLSKMLDEFTDLLNHIEKFVRRWGALSHLLEQHLTDSQRAALEGQMARIEEFMA